MLKVQKLRPTATLPTRGSDKAVGYDLYADTPDKNLIILSGLRMMVPTGIAVCPPDGYFARVAPRSGLALKNGIDVLAGVIDPDYTGECFAMLFNTGTKQFVIEHGARIAQFILLAYAAPDVVEVDTLEAHTRGADGFGSTG